MDNNSTKHDWQEFYYFLLCLVVGYVCIAAGWHFALPLVSDGGALMALTVSGLVGVVEIFDRIL